MCGLGGSAFDSWCLSISAWMVCSDSGIFDGARLLLVVANCRGPARAGLGFFCLTSSARAAQPWLALQELLARWRQELPRQSQAQRHH